MRKIDRQEKVNQIRKETFEQAKQIVEQKGKCAIIRPTGFGKTGIQASLIREYKSVLYLYPTDVVRDAVLDFYYGTDNVPEDRDIPNVTFMTYAKLRLLTREEMKALPDFEIIMVDECHTLGAQETMRAMDMLIELKPKAKLLGASATPDRMDLVDEIGRYFDDNTTDEYTLHDAFQDGILLKPYYVYCGYGSVEENRQLVKRETDKELQLIESPLRVKLKKDLNQRLIEISNLCNMDNVIRTTCTRFVKNTDKMRFIVFFSTFEAMHEKEADIIKWFQMAFPAHRVSSIIVSSETEVSRNNVEIIRKPFQCKGKGIELIYCCDMLTFGYHVDGLTGIMMCRGTQSGIVYTQQLGRVLSTGSNTPGIVFDVVDNLHQQSMYKLLGEESKFTRAGRARKKVLEEKKEKAEKYNLYIGKDNVHIHDNVVQTDPVMNNDDETESNATPSSVTRPALTEKEVEEFQKIRNGEQPAPEWSKMDENELRSLERRFKEGIPVGGYYELKPEDLIAVGFEGKYRDLIRKTVAEARSMRCRHAWFSWIEKGGNPYDENGRIRTRAEILALQPPENHPLPPFCRSKHVSVEAVLDEMSVKDVPTEGKTIMILREEDDDNEMYRRVSGA